MILMDLFYLLIFVSDRSNESLTSLNTEHLVCGEFERLGEFYFCIICNEYEFCIICIEFELVKLIMLMVYSNLFVLLLVINALL